MFFNSLDFAIFLPIVFTLYWLLRDYLKLQNFLLVIASYVFYGWWDYTFLSLILFSTLVDYTIGVNLDKTTNQSKRKILLYISVFVNLGFLGFFKYYNFFVDSFQDAFSLLGYEFKLSTLQIVLPVGISFYTFQTMSYTIDVYKKKLKSTKDFVAFSAFVSFFPQLVAGPIERATNLLPQFYKKRTFDYYKAVDGMQQILWGLFKKVVIADNCATYANEIFGQYTELSGSTLLLGAVLFSIQIYGDFSGYSDIAIGTARLFGFNLMQNFSFPYFSRDIAEFWRRWHISLTTWFRDYLYIPLGGSRGGMWSKVRNTFIIFLVSGFWHGANWTFVFWGALNALYFLPLLLTNNNRRNLNLIAGNRLLPSLRESLAMLSTFALSTFAWIFFRSESLTQAFDYIGRLFSKSLFTPINGELHGIGRFLFVVAFFFVLEWLGRSKQFAIQGFLVNRSVFIRWGFYFFLLFIMFLFMGEEQDFIYFQF